MNNLNVEPDVSVKKFFEEIIPSIFKETLAQTPPSPDMAGTEFRIQFNITGEKGGVYAIVVKDAKEMQVVPGGIPDPMIEITLTESDWRRSITSKVGGVLTMFFDPKTRTRNKYNSLLETKGKFHLELSVEGGEPFNAILRFNKSDAPEVKLMMSAQDYAAMMRRELNSTMAFMQGRLKFKGDMGFLMKLQSFMT
jgi:putative sterol carrier protein